MAGSGRTDNTISGGVAGPVIQARDVTVRLPPSVIPALSGLPAGSPAFTGREAALRSLLDTLAPRPGDVEAGDAGPAVVVSAVGGLAGIGKTELAVQAARTALERGWFPGGVLFVDLFGYDPDRRVDPAQALDGWLRALGIPGDQIPPGLQDRTRLYTSALAAHAAQGQRILLVIDNASAPDQARPLLPTDGTTAAIVTSRDTLATLPSHLLDLTVLSLDEAVNLLDQQLQVNRPGDTRIRDAPEDAATIAELCGCLPLALTIVAALLAENPARTPHGLATDLTDTSSRLEELTYADKGVRAAFDLSYRRLDPAHARLFRLLPVNPGPDISTEAATALTDQPTSQTRRGLQALARAHLIDHGTTENRWRLHDLIRLYATTHPDDRAPALTRLLNHYRATTEAATQHLNPTAQPERSRFTGRDDALSWLDIEYANLTATIHTAATHPDHLTIARSLPLDLATFFEWRRHFEDWITLTIIAANAARTLSDRHGEGATLSSLGFALREGRRFNEAITACETAAQIFRDTGDRHGEGAALGNLGVALQGAQRFDEAITSHHEAAQIFRDTGDRHGEGAALGNLGVALRRVAALQ